MKRKTSILIVDDDRTIRKLLERVAERAGFDVDCARDGVEALELLGTKTYEIAIVDLMMPRVSGYELVQKMSTLDPRPVVLVATAMSNGDVASLDDSMVRRVIRKPFDVDALAKALLETAAQLKEQQTLEQQEIPVAPPEVAAIPVVVRPSPGTPKLEAAPPRPAEEEEQRPAEDAAPPKNVH